MKLFAKPWLLRVLDEPKRYKYFNQELYNKIPWDILIGMKRYKIVWYILGPMNLFTKLGNPRHWKEFTA